MGAISKTDFIDRVKTSGRWRAKTTDRFYSDLDLMADDALRAHDESLTWDIIRAEDIYPVMLKYGVMLHQARASQYTEEYNVSGNEGGIDRSQVVNNSLQMSDALQREYDLTVNNRTIVVGDIMKFDILLDRRTPENANLPPQVPTLSATGSTGKVEFTWSELVTGNFRRVNIYLAPSSNGTLLDSFQRTGIIEHLQPITAIYEKWVTAYRQRNVLVGEHLAVITVEDYNGRVAVSNEVTVTVV
jgi:hypothetical protein